MKKSIKFLAMALCLALVVSLCAVMFAANTKTSAADYKDGEWVTKGTTFKFDGKDYTVNKDQNFSGEYITVDGTNYYLLSDVDDIKALGTTMGDESFIIANDIELGAWTEQVAVYASVIEGCGHKVTFAEGSTEGLFQSYAGVINNLVLEGKVVGNGHIGTLIDTFMDGTLDGIVNNASLTNEKVGGDAKTGGIVGAADVSFGNFTIQNCVNNGAITGDIRVAGIIGNLQTSPWNDTNATGVFNLINCTNNGAISSANWGPGGIMSICEFYGTGEINIIGCVNNGDVKGKQNAGGIVGTYVAPGTIEGCINKGNITSEAQHAGGIFGRAKCGDNAEVIVSNCVNFGNISAGKNAAGICGLIRTSRMSFLQCASFGTITAVNAENGAAYGLGCREATDTVLNAAEEIYYIGADSGYNTAEGETDSAVKLTDAQVTSNYIVDKFNAANEADGNKIRWTVADGKPAIDMNTLIETTTEATTPAATTTAKKDETTAATTTAKADDTTAAKTTAATTAEEKEGGCGGSLTVASVMILTTAITGSALVVTRKRK